MTGLSDWRLFYGSEGLAFTCVVVGAATQLDFIRLHATCVCAKTDPAAVSAVRCSPLDSVTLT